MMNSFNELLLGGTVAAAPVYSHTNHGTAFFSFPLAVERLSGQTDKLRILCPEKLLERVAAEEGAAVTVQGQLRSFNNKTGQGNRLVLSGFARNILPGSEAPVNRIRLAGVLCKPPVLRRTPRGREICDVILAVNRRYGRADYLPCIAWGAVAQSINRMVVGDPLAFEGRLQSRIYHKQENGTVTERTAYEVSVMRPIGAEDFI